MSTIDITQVAGLQAVNAEGNVIGTLSVDDLTELVANNLVKSTQNQIAAARSVSTMSEASTLAASDDYENTLPIDANPASVRTLDADGNPKQTGITAFAQVVGGLVTKYYTAEIICGNKKVSLVKQEIINTIKTILQENPLITNKNQTPIYIHLSGGGSLVSSKKWESDEYVIATGGGNSNMTIYGIYASSDKIYANYELRAYTAANMYLGCIFDDIIEFDSNKLIYVS